MRQAEHAEIVPSERLGTYYLRAHYIVGRVPWPGTVSSLQLARPRGRLFLFSERSAERCI